MEVLWGKGAHPAAVPARSERSTAVAWAGGNLCGPGPGAAGALRTVPARQRLPQPLRFLFAATRSSAPPEAEPPQVMGLPGLLALFSSQRKNPVLVNVLIVSSIISSVAILIIIVYSSLTLSYGEEEELSSALVHVIHTKFILNKVVKGANIAMLAASVCSAFVVLVMAYLGCRSLPRCSCYDSVTGMEWLQPSEDQNQTVEMICAAQSPGGRIFNFPDQFPAQDLDTEEDASKPPPYIRMA
ncbi:uncharacterized protein LOC115610226 [Strigops habroptila]|uniref:uncharacterized protein LOC115610226 n=1 Tax=Strigops habroptila TaxID=2489341 RepID=UPI0011CFE7A7|nr:uncharacterized protein LOC115610226 [Strigops habroptila]